jgi:hypothetical protein
MTNVTAVATLFEFLRAPCGSSFANFAVKGSCCLWKATDFNRKGREGRAASYAKKIKIEPLPKKLNN